MTFLLDYLTHAIALGIGIGIGAVITSRELADTRRELQWLWDQFHRRTHAGGWVPAPKDWRAPK